MKIAVRYDSYIQLKRLIDKYGKEMFKHVPEPYGPSFFANGWLQTHLGTSNVNTAGYCFTPDAYGEERLIEDGFIILSYFRAMHSKDFENYMNEEKKPLLTLKEQIDLAKTYIGQNIKSATRGDVGTVAGYKFFEDSSKLREEIATITYGEVYQPYLERDGGIVCLFGQWHDTNREMKRPVVGLPIEIIKTVTINGYTGNDCGDHYQFGCATIDKEVLKAAKTLLELSYGNTGKGNRKVKNITIGNGTFSLEDLNNMNLKIGNTAKSVDHSDQIVQIY